MLDLRTEPRAFTQRRIGLCGTSSGIDARAAEFCQEVGAAMISETSAVLVTAGARGELSLRGQPRSADWYFVKGAEDELHRRGQAAEARIETMLPAGAEPGDGYFTAGRVLFVRARTREARRFAFVRHVQGLLAVGGGKGTRQSLMLAAALELPVLPVVGFGGAAEDHWREHESDIRAHLRLNGTPVACSDTGPAKQIAARLVRQIAERIGRQCFVIMPFTQSELRLYLDVIEPAVRGVGDTPIRVDRTLRPGEVGRQIEDGILACDYAIAVLDGLRPNVMYELGRAHALAKPVILVRAPETGLPFDIATHQCLEIAAVDTAAKARLAEAITALAGYRA